MPTFSVIVPVYNVEPYIKDCLDSILCQTYTDYELIIIDDGSPDNCGRIIDDYSGKDSRIKVIHSPNEGLSAARNKGLDIAMGKYIYFADSDDTLDPHLLEKILPEMDAGFDMVCFHIDCIYEKPILQKPNHQIPPDVIFDLSKDEDKYNFILYPLRHYKIFFEVFHRCFRRDIIEKWHMRFVDGDRIFAEDFQFLFCYVAHSSTIHLIPDVLYHYRIRDDSIMGQNRNALRLKEDELLASSILDHYRQSSDCNYLCDHYLELYYALQKDAFSRLRKKHWQTHMDIDSVRDFTKNTFEDYSRLIANFTELYRSSRPIKDKGSIKQNLRDAVNRIYIEDLLDLPVSKTKKYINKAVLFAARKAYILNVYNKNDCQAGVPVP